MGGIAVRPDFRYAAAGSFDSQVYVADLRQMRVGGVLTGHGDRVSRVAIRGDTVASVSYDATVRLWEF